MKTKLLCFVVAALAFQSCSKVPEAATEAATTEEAAKRAPADIPCYTNPVQNESGDPYCFKYNGKFYLYRPDGKKVMVSESTDLKTWTTPVAAFTHTKNVWAPEVHVINGSLYLYFAVPNLDVENDRDIMGCLMASPTSNGTNSPVLMLDDAHINIDPTVYVEGSNAWLIWKHKNNDGTDTHLRIRQLSWSNPTTFSGTGARLYETASGSQNTEHPDIVMQEYTEGGVAKKRYFLFYNTNAGETEEYRIDYATCSTLTGTYAYKGILVQKNIANGIYGPGGQSVVRDGDNYRWLVYRTKVNRDVNWLRQTSIDRLFINATANTADCTPTMGTQSPYCPVGL